ncbi:hypothetical protein EVAR_28247_1 [Eumeta japonica]|uniref:Reverse transcriptase domain-containing protein n=1 Tax=Eumeta variegata TaxID=151549 RepID=A0A4C1V5K9_EUMVA|nr:hypothetical protein EVAR_28247_1 [Eumeta japonica]
MIVLLDMLRGGEGIVGRLLYQLFNNGWKSHRIEELPVKCLLYANNQVILAPSSCELQEMLTKMNYYVQKRGVKVNVSKTKIEGRHTLHADLLLVESSNNSQVFSIIQE